MPQSGLRTPHLLHELPFIAADTNAEHIAVVVGERSVSYAELCAATYATAAGFAELGVRHGDRVAIYLNKTLDTVAAILAASCTGAMFVPINPVLKPDQVTHILNDSGSRLLLTSVARLETLGDLGARCSALGHILTTDNSASTGSSATSMADLCNAPKPWTAARRTLETDAAAILYTSGSTGRPKGVVLSHRNLVVGAISVAQYLGNNPSDRILSLLPLSFDAGFSQLSTAFASGASVVLLDYLLPQDVVRVCEREKITGITGVPPLWMQLTQSKWTEAATANLRYFANTGGKMPRQTLSRLRSLFKNAAPFLMYGLTEAFRSTYLPPEEVDRRPDSIGKAIPNVEVLVVRPDGSPCAPNEPGELVHRGPLVGLGYWRDRERTRERYRPAPGQPDGLPQPELAVWSGDTVTMDDDGFLYFVGRHDDMIKTSGYRVSPTEIEEVAFQSGLIAEGVAFGIAHETLGQTIVVVGRPSSPRVAPSELVAYYRSKVPAYMVPQHVFWWDELPRNPNGKIDRKAVSALVVAEMAEPDATQRHDVS